MPTVTAVSPLRSDYRFLRRLVSSILGGKVEEVPEEFDMMIRVFARAGGSWERIFKGSPRDIALLKDIVKVAYRKGHLTKKHQWGSA